MTSGIDVSWAWSIGLITFAFGLACGVGIGYLVLGGKQRARELQDRLDGLQQEFDNYRDQVGQHFLTTSTLVQKMTDSYREVYEHLAAGSQALCQNPISTPRLDIPEHPTLESRPEKQDVASETQDSFSEAQANGIDDADSDNYLGDAPRVPTLDTEELQPTRTTHHTQ